MADAVGTITSTMTSGLGSLGQYMWIVWTLLGLGIFAAIAYFAVTWKKTGDKWTLTLRIRQENNQHKTLYLDPVIVKGRRVTLSNGLRLIYLQKPILGKRLFPLLNYYTRPGVYDLVVTSDNRIFIITGIAGIDEQRKELKVGVRYPGIDYSLEEVNRDHAKLNQLDRKSDLLGIVKAAASAVIAVVILVAFIVGMKYYSEGKAMDDSIAKSQLALFQTLEDSEIKGIEQTNAMRLLVAEMEDMLDTNDLRRELNNLPNV